MKDAPAACEYSSKDIEKQWTMQMENKKIKQKNMQKLEKKMFMQHIIIKSSTMQHAGEDQQEW